MDITYVYLVGLFIFAAMVAGLIHLITKNNKLEKAYSEVVSMIIAKNTEINQLKIHAETDPLTGAPNRRMFYRLFDKFLFMLPFADERRHNASLNSLGLMCIDVDEFKNINDTYGHQIGDNVLTGIVVVAKEHLRASDTICRIGGDEFVVLLPGVPKEKIKELATSILEAVTKKDFNIPCSVTLSIGVTFANKQFPKEFLLERADEMLYKAKNNGRNQVVVG